MRTENNCAFFWSLCQRLSSAAGPALGTGAAFGHDIDWLGCFEGQSCWADLARDSTCCLTDLWATYHSLTTGCTQPDRATPSSQPLYHHGQCSWMHWHTTYWRSWSDAGPELPHLRTGREGKRWRGRFREPPGGDEGEATPSSRGRHGPPPLSKISRHDRCSDTFITATHDKCWCIN